MHDLAESIHDLRAVEVDPGRRLVRYGIVGRPAVQWFQRLIVRMAADCLEQRMARRDPLQGVLLGGLSIRAAARIPARQFRQLPVGFALVAAEG